MTPRGLLHLGPAAVAILAARAWVRVAAEILNNIDGASQKALIDSLNQVDQKLAESLRDEMFTFDDLAKLDKRSMQKIISSAGIASRRAAEKLIREGRVQVNGITVTELGTKADPQSDDIRVDGRRIKAAAERRYLLLYKPRGVVSTRTDPQRRTTVVDLVAQQRRIIVGGHIGEAAERRVEHPDDLGRFIIHDRAPLLVPERRHGDPAGELRVGEEIDLGELALQSFDDR